MSAIVLTDAESPVSLAAVLPNCLEAMRGNESTLGLPPVRGAVVMLVDGLGADLLRARAGHARHLVAGWEPDDVAMQFPSTTVSGITSLTTASTAGEHGLVGYSVWERETGMYRNQLSGWGAGMDPVSWQLRPTVFETLRTTDPEFRSFVVSVADYAESGLTMASLRGAQYVAAETMHDRCVAAARLCRRERRPLVYLYHAELDQAGHRFGAESGEWLEALEELDSAMLQLRRELPSDIGLLVVADHGMLDVSPDRHIDLSDVLLDGVIAMAGEPRLRHLYLREPETAAEVAARIAEAESERAVVVTREAAIAAGWYGAQVDPRAAARMGEVLVAATAPVTYYAEWMPANMRGMIGQHGSITPTETRVPLIRHGAFRR